MNILKRIAGLLKNSVSELTDAVIAPDAPLKQTDADLLTEQVKRAHLGLENSKQALSTLSAHKLSTQRMLTHINEQILSLETEAIAALNANQEQTALSLAEKISDFKSDQQIQTDTFQLTSDAVERAEYKVERATQTLIELQREVAMIQTTNTVQSATIQLRDQLQQSKGSLTNARDTLERIKAKQLAADDLAAAQDEVALEGDFEQRLKDAGIVEDTNNPQLILDNLKKGNI